MLSHGKLYLVDKNVNIGNILFFNWGVPRFFIRYNIFPTFHFFLIQLFNNNKIKKIVSY